MACLRKKGYDPFSRPILVSSLTPLESDAGVPIDVVRRELISTESYTNTISLARE